MVSQKRSCHKEAVPRQNSNGCFSDDFPAIISVFQSPEGIKPPILKKLYCLLVGISANVKWSPKNTVGSGYFGLETCYIGIKVTFEDVCVLSNSLFAELAERFEKISSTLLDISENESRSENESESDLHLFDDVEVVNLLLRCCMLLLTLLAAQQNLMLEKGQILLRVIKKLCSPIWVENKGKHVFIYNKSVFRRCDPGSKGCSTSFAEDFTASLQILEPCNPLHFFMSAMLEVFVDECFVNGHLRRYFKMICSVASKNETLLNPHPSQGDFGIVMEAICNHFILSFSDKQAFDDFLSRLFSAHAEENRYSFVAPALSVSTAVSLLFCPIMISGPKYMQAHLIFMVSRATQAVMKIESLKPDRKLVNCFLAIFEKSVSLYKLRMSYLQKDGYSTSASECAISGTSDETAHLPFDFLISLDTKKRFDGLLAKLNHASNQRLHDRFSKIKSELVCSSIRVVKEFQNVYGISCHDDILAISTCLIHQVSGSFDEITMYSMEAMTMQDIYLLASLLKLMGTSLLGVIWCLRNNNDLCCLNTLKDFSSSKEYDFILGAVTCFRDFPTDLPLQQYLSNVLSCHSEGSKDSKMMFLHFAGLMSLSFACGLDCLVKGSLLTILGLLNLFIFEEGGLDALNKMVDSKTGSLSSGFPVVRIQETMVDQNPSIVVASKFQKIRSLYSRMNDNRCKEVANVSSQSGLATGSHMEAVVGLEEETEETSNGEIFLSCMMGERTSGFEDLADFIECKQGKDYTAWLKNRQRYRKRRFEKLAVLKWKRRKKTLKTMKGRSRNQA
ncbi:uncharacterized protein [Primulina eburnea]|uniref:uncharacterized protein isoform X1 n=1 Tax=Primulina eburnea TaxID=1245227 RepID=UPI003C6C87DD